MPLATYVELKTAIASWLDREDADFIARIPDFISLCEQRLNFGDASSSGLRLAEMEQTALIAFVDGQALLPDDYLEARLFRSTVYPYGPIDVATPTSAAATSGGQIVGSGTAELTYYAKIPALSDDTPTNWLLMKSPNVYLYGSLLEAAPFESDDARMQTWQALYASAAAGLKSTDVGARFALGRARVRGATP